MAESILKLKVSSEEYDNKLKRAAEGLQRYVSECRKVGGTLEVVEKDTLDFVKAMGQMEATAKTATGKLSEMKRTFTEWGMVYKQMTDAEKASPVGKALAQSLDQLKGRIQQTKRDMEGLNQELSGSKFGQFGSVIDTLGQKLGLTTNVTELLTSKTALMYSGIGAGIAVVTKATEAWASYNAELSKQDQITTVTTGLKGADSDRMTDQARSLTDTYGVDFREAINAANTLMTQFGQTGEQAMSLIRDGMQGMIQGDGPKLLSMIQQYAPAFRDAGVTASQLVAVIQNSEGGIFTDQNMNAIVMGIKNIRLMTKATSDALAQLGIDGQKMSQQLRDGSLTIFDALKQVATQIQGVNSNSQAAGEVMQQVFGRQGAMAGTKLGEAIATLNTNLGETKRQTGELGDAYNDLYNANVKLNGAIRDCFEYDGWDQMATGIKANLVSALASVLDYLGKIKGALGGFSVSQQQGDSRNGGGANLEKNISMLGNGKGNKPQDTFRRQMQEYSRVLFRVNDQITDLQRKAGEDMDGNMAMVYEKQIRTLENRRVAIQRNMNEYERRARELFNKANGNEDTTKIEPITPTDTTKSKGTNPIKQAQDKVAAAQHDYAQSIEKAKMSLDNGTSTEADYKKKLLSAEERLWDALGDAHNVYADPKYKQAQDECAAKIKLLGGEVTASVEAQKKTQEAARQLEQAQKKLADAEREQSAAAASGLLGDKFTADKKVARARADMQTAQNNIDTLQGKVPTYLTKKQKAVFQIEVDDTKYEEFVRTFQGRKDIKINTVKGDTYTPEEMPDQNIKVNIEADTQDAYDEINRLTQDIQGRQVTITPVVSKAKLSQANLDAIGKEMTLKIQNVELGSAEYEDISARLFDATAVQNLMQETMRMGLTVPEDVRQGLIDALTGPLEEGIPDEVFDKWVEQLNQFRSDNPLVLDMQTGKVSGNQEGESGKGSTDKALRDISKGISGLSSIQSGLEGLGVKVPSEIEKALGVINALMTVIQGVQTVISIFSIGSQTANTVAVGLNTVAVASLEAAIWANTATSLIPFLRNGGIAHAANGFVPGNDHNDNIPVMVSSGELILNRAQQGNIASQLQDGAQQNRGSEASSPYVTGETIFLGVNNYLQRSGRGEIVTTKQR